MMHTTGAPANAIVMLSDGLVDATHARQAAAAVTTTTTTTTAASAAPVSMFALGVGRDVDVNVLRFVIGQPQCTEELLTVTTDAAEAEVHAHPHVAASSSSSAASSSSSASTMHAVPSTACLAQLRKDARPCHYLSLATLGYPRGRLPFLGLGGPPLLGCSASLTSERAWAIRRAKYTTWV